MRHLLNLFTAYIKANSRLFAGGIVIGLIIFYLSFHGFIWLRNRPQREVIGLAGNYTLSSLPADVQDRLSYGLTTIAPDMSVASGAAQSWEASGEGKIYVFKLKPGLVWHDGKNFVASDVNYNLADVKITTPDNETIVFTLSEPFAPLPSVLSQPLFRPGLIGLGKYKLVSFKNAGRFLQWVLLSDGKDELMYKFYPTKEAELMALKLGEIKKADGIFDSRGKPDYFHEAILFFNDKAPLITEKAFRQALAYSISSVPDFGEKSDGPIAPVSWAYNPNIKKYPLDLKTAKNLLSKTSASESAGLVISVTADLKPVADSLATDWTGLGVKTTTETVEFPPDNYQVFLSYVDIPADPDQYFLWHSISQQNITGYHSPKVDKLLEEGRQIIDPETRKQKYLDFQKAILDYLPAVFLFYPKVYSLTR